ncbi:CACNA1A [Symbiodinium sp. CCMP2592]|nr:CACNA1A [Symbiodinium sp. CCMP2592]
MIPNRAWAFLFLSFLTFPNAEEAEDCDAARTELLQVGLGLHKDEIKDEVMDPSLQYTDCWNHSFPRDADVFHLHIPKVAGCSTVHDLGQIVGRENLYSDEICFSFSKLAVFHHTVVMLRRPRDHVFSMYQHCYSGGGPGYYAALKLMNAAPGEPGFSLPDTFGKWIHSWVTKPHFGFYGVYADEFHCYFPKDLQSHRMTCALPDEREATVSVAAAIENMKTASMVGITEAYHESMCLFAAKLTGSLPSYCDCENSTAWSAFEGTDEDHGVSYNDTVEAQPPDVLAGVDYLTQGDRQLYNASVERFIRDIKEVETNFGMKVLCGDQETALREKMVV